MLVYQGYIIWNWIWYQSKYHRGINPLGVFWSFIFRHCLMVASQAYKVRAQAQLPGPPVETWRRRTAGDFTVFHSEESVVGLGLF